MAHSKRAAVIKNATGTALLNGTAVLDKPLPTPVPLSLPRPPMKDPAVWKRAFTPPSQGPLSGAGPITNPDLVMEICKYGDFCQITLDNFMTDTAKLESFVARYPERAKERAASVLGPYKVGTFLFMPSEIMERPPGLQPGELDVAPGAEARAYTLGIAGKDGRVEDDPTFFLVATSGLFRGEIPEVLVDDVSTNWIGYVAVGPKHAATGKRDIVVVFRGTQAKTEWLSNVTFAMTRWEGADTALPLWKRVAHFLFGAWSQAPAHAAARGTKTAPESVSAIVSRVRVALGWEIMYRAFSQTPGNTLSMQARRSPAALPAKSAQS